MRSDGEGAAPQAVVADDGEPLRVLIGESHPLTRFGVRRSLEEHGFTVCAEADDASSAVEAAVRERPDVCLLDLHIPGDAIAAVAAIASQLPETGVVMLTGSRDDDRLFGALCAGALGDLPKDIDPARLPLALPRVLEGEARLPRAVVARLIDEFRERGPQRRLPFGKDRDVQLTTREWEVLELLREGLTTAEIAGRLFISQVTVRSHVASILKKLSVPDRKTAIRLLQEH